MGGGFTGRGPGLGFTAEAVVAAIFVCFEPENEIVSNSERDLLWTKSLEMSYPHTHFFSFLLKLWTGIRRKGGEKIQDLYLDKTARSELESKIKKYLFYSDKGGTRRIV